jgi:hypothetical protein
VPSASRARSSPACSGVFMYNSGRRLLRRMNTGRSARIASTTGLGVGDRAAPPVKPGLYAMLVIRRDPPLGRFGEFSNARSREQVAQLRRRVRACGGLGCMRPAVDVERFDALRMTRGS